MQKEEFSNFILLSLPEELKKNVTFADELSNDVLKKIDKDIMNGKFSNYVFDILKTQITESGLENCLDSNNKISLENIRRAEKVIKDKPEVKSFIESLKNNNDNSKTNEENLLSDKNLKIYEIFQNEEIKNIFGNMSEKSFENLLNIFETCTLSDLNNFINVIGANTDQYNKFLNDSMTVDKCSEEDIAQEYIRSMITLMKYTANYGIEDGIKKLKEELNRDLEGNKDENDSKHKITKRMIDTFDPLFRECIEGMNEAYKKDPEKIKELMFFLNKIADIKNQESDQKSYKEKTLQRFLKIISQNDEGKIKEDLKSLNAEIDKKDSTEFKESQEAGSLRISDPNSFMSNLDANFANIENENSVDIENLDSTKIPILIDIYNRLNSGEQSENILGDLRDRIGTDYEQFKEICDTDKLADIFELHNERQRAIAKTRENSYTNEDKGISDTNFEKVAREKGLYAEIDTSGIVQLVVKQRAKDEQLEKPLPISDRGETETQTVESEVGANVVTDTGDIEQEGSQPADDIGDIGRLLPSEGEVFTPTPKDPEILASMMGVKKIDQSEIENDTNEGGSGQVDNDNNKGKELIVLTPWDKIRKGFRDFITVYKENRALRYSPFKSIRAASDQLDIVQTIKDAFATSSNSSKGKEEYTEVKNQYAKDYEGPTSQLQEPKNITIPGSVDISRPATKPKVGVDEVQVNDQVINNAVKNPISKPEQQIKEDNKLTPEKPTNEGSDLEHD